MFKEIKKKVDHQKNTAAYLDTVNQTIIQLDELKSEHGLEPKYIVLGWKNYIELMKYASHEMKRPHVLREWMGCEIVVVKGISIVQVVPDITDLVGFRSS